MESHVVKVKRNELTNLESLAAGAYRVVKKVSRNHPSLGPIEVVAKERAKEFHAADCAERDLLSELDHPNIARLLGVVDDEEFTLILELCDGGDLSAYLRMCYRNNGDGLPYYQFYDWAEQAARPLEYLGMKHIVHGDVKSSNCLITGGNILKVCDFELAKRNVDQPIEDVEVAGTIAWMAPELITERILTPKYDIFSYGVVLWEMRTGKTPFQGEASYHIMWKIGHENQRLPIPESCPKPIKDLMSRCWGTDWKKRPDMTEVIDMIKSAAAAAATKYGQKHVIPEPEKPTKELGLQDSILAETEKSALGMAGDFCKAMVKKIDDQGGTVQLPDINITLKIPQGALKEPTEVSLSVEPYEDHPLLEEDQLIIGPVVSCKPDGLTFLKLVTISLPHSGVNINERCLQVWSKHSSWEKIYDGPAAAIYQDDVSVAVEGNKIKFRVKHFTLFDVVTVPVSMLLSWLMPYPAMVLDMYAYMDPVVVSTARSVRLRVYAIKRTDVISRKMMEEEERGCACGRCCIPWCLVLKQNGNSLQITAQNIHPADKWIPNRHGGRGEILYAHIQAGGTRSRCEIEYRPHDDMEQAEWLEGSFQTGQDGNPDIVQSTFFDDTTAQRNSPKARGVHDQELPARQNLSARHPRETEDIPPLRASSNRAALEQSVTPKVKRTGNTSSNQIEGMIKPFKSSVPSTLSQKSGKPSANSASSLEISSLLEHCSLTASSDPGSSTLGDTGPFLKTVARKIEPKWREVATTLGFSTDQCKEFEGTWALSTWWPAYKMLLAWQSKMSPCDFKQLLSILADSVRPLDEQLAIQIIR